LAPRASATRILIAKRSIENPKVGAGGTAKVQPKIKGVWMKLIFRLQISSESNEFRGQFT
jgi:hypothetical protein